MKFTVKQQAMIVSALSLAVQEGQEDISAIADNLGQPWAFATASILSLQDHLDPERIQNELEDFPLSEDNVLAFMEEMEKSYKQQIASMDVALARALTDLATANARLMA